MKKIFAVIMIVCLLASMLCFAAFAEDETNWGKVNADDIEIDPDVERTEGASGVWWSSADGTASMLGNGSLAMVVALASLVTSIVSIGLVVNMKKKLASVVANSTAKTKEEE